MSGLDLIKDYEKKLNSKFLRFINLILYLVFGLLQQTLDNSYDIQLLLIFFLSF